ncbi:unnamed protein product [Adineta steineri]|nr:unnamed protein product [Adineta steineri]CAF1261709.1 unnamed protein product [Adineta steineri]CAF3635723.1 unnamed protein product [Adineta steineri]
MSNPVSKQPGSGGDLYPYNGAWSNELFASFKPCPQSALFCFCLPCCVAKMSERQGDHILTCCVNPCTLMAIRTKVRAAYKIKGSLIEDCLVSACCVGPCAAMQLDKELTARGIPEKRAK